VERLQNICILLLEVVALHNQGICRLTSLEHENSFYTFRWGLYKKTFKLSSTAARLRLEVFPHQIKIWALLDNWWKRHITLERDSPSSMHNQNHTTAPTQMHWMLLQRSWSPNHLFCFFLRAFDQEYLPTQNNLLFKIRSEQIHS